ncbi:MAG: hypothetical protein SGCHY_003128 [Lobulomycetales sp.]
MVSAQTLGAGGKWPLEFRVHAECSVTRARAASLILPNNNCPTPMFMPVATSAVMKGVTVRQLEDLKVPLILNNTYHLALNPGQKLLDSYDGTRKFMGWKRAMLTDSGGYQMVSLSKLSTVVEDGVTFSSHFDQTPVKLRPEDSIALQKSIGADILMQLDDVVSSKELSESRVEEAMWRSIRWLDRCLSCQPFHNQNVFAIIQGGLDTRLRKICVEEMIKRDCPGYAIGGLSGGESKDKFWRVVKLCTSLLPRDKPIYCMGVGYAEDLVVCSALGVDMHNIAFQMRLMADIQDSIKGGTFPDFVRDFMYKFYKQMLKDGRKFGLNKDDADGDPGKVLNENGYPN